MSKKDYIKFAEMFNQQLADLNRNSFDDTNYQAIATVVVIAELTADIFEQDNPRFNRSKFLVACGTKEN